MMPTKDKKLPFDKKQSKQVVGGLDCEESLKASLLQKDRNIVMLKKMAVMAELMYEHKGEEKALANLKRRVYKRIEMITIAAVMVFVFFWLFRNEDHVKMMLQDVKEFLLDKW